MTQTIAPFEVQCPSCATPFPVAPDRVPDDGVHAVCSMCRRTFLVELPAELRHLEWISTAGGFMATAQPDFSVPAPGGETAASAAVDPGIVEEIEVGPSGSGVEEEIDFEVVSEASAGIAEDLDVFDFEEVGVADAVEELEVDEVADATEELAVETVADAVEELEVDEVQDALEELEVEAVADVVEVPGVPEIEAGQELAEAIEEFEVEEVTEAVGVPDLAEVSDIAEAIEEVESVPSAPSREPPPPDPEIENLSSLTQEVLAEEPAEESPRPTLSEGAARFGRRDPHERARRLARVLVSDIIAYYPEKHAEAVRRGTVRDEFEDEVRKSWKEFVDQVGSELAEGTPYFKEALNEVLARGQQVY